MIPKQEIKPKGTHALIKYEGVGPAVRSSVVEVGTLNDLYYKRDVLNVSCTVGPRGLVATRYGVSPQ